MNKNCRVWTIKDNYHLGDDIQSKVLAFAFGLSAEIERNLISQRTKESLARMKADGIALGRPSYKQLQTKHKLFRKDKEIRRLKSKGLSFREIAERLNVNRETLRRYFNRFIRL